MKELSYFEKQRRKRAEFLKTNKKKMVLLVILFLFCTVVLIPFTGCIDMLLSRRIDSLTIYTAFTNFLVSSKQRMLFFVFDFSLFSVCLYLLFVNPQPFKSELVKITEDIYIPAPAGQFQYGSARFLTEKEVGKKFAVYYVDPKDKPIAELIRLGDEIKNLVQTGKCNKEFEEKVQDMPISDENFDTDEYVEDDPWLTNNDNAAIEKGDPAITLTKSFKYFELGGLVCGMEKFGNVERWYVDTDDSHTVSVGMTGIGKSRREVIQSVLCMAFAEEGIVVTDPKGGARRSRLKRVSTTQLNYYCFI